MRRQISVFFATIISIAWTAASPLYAAEPFIDPIYGYSVTRNIVYAQGATSGGPINLLCDIYRPTDIGQGAVPELSPAIIMQHGGAWTSGSKDQGIVTEPAIFMARHGFTCITVNYRLYDDNPTNPVGTGPWSGLSFPFYLEIYPGLNVIRAGIEDFGAAMAWTKANAATYGIDPDKIGAAGGSAGGINALFHTYNSPPADSAPKVVVALVSTMYGNHNLITAGEPPAFLVNSVSDLIILYSPDVEDMIARMDAVGVYNEPWIHDLGAGTHDVDWHYLLDGETVLERTKDFLACKLAGVPAACLGGGPTPTPIASPTASPTETPTPSPTDTPTTTPLQTATETPSPTPNETETPTPSATETETETPTPSPSDTPTTTPLETATPTPTPTETETPTASATETATETPTATPTSSVTPTASVTPAAGNDAVPAGHSVPSTVPPGITFNVGIVFHNTGNTTWTLQADYALSVLGDDCDVISNDNIPVRDGDQVAPGMFYQFLESLTIPAAPQSCMIEVRMIQAGELFGAPQTINFNVALPPNAVRNWTFYE